MQLQLATAAFVAAVLVVGPSGCRPAQEPVLDQDQAINVIKKLGGSVEMDKDDPGQPVVYVSFRLISIKDTDLACLKSFPKLQRLNLCTSDVTDAGLKELAALKGLETLDLSDTRVTDAGMKELAGLKGLKVLDLSQTKVTDAGMKELVGQLLWMWA